MTDIQVNEYVRTEDGYISKVALGDGYSLIFNSTIKVSYGEEKEILYSWEFEKITKHSFNLIDLIEVGDYVNGEEIKEIGIIRIGLYKGQKALFTQNYAGKYFRNEDIQTIVTHEQFKAMEYKVGGEDD